MQVRGGTTFIIGNVLRTGMHPGPGEQVTLRPRDIRRFHPFPYQYRDGRAESAPHVTVELVSGEQKTLHMSYREFCDAMVAAGVRLIDATHKPVGTESPQGHGA